MVPNTTGGRLQAWRLAEWAAILVHYTAGEVEVTETISVSSAAAPGTLRALVTPAEFIDRHPAELLGRLQQLIGVSTVNPPGENYDQISGWLAHELEALGARTRRYAIPAVTLKKALPPEQHAFPRFNVLGKIASPGAKRTIHFNAHYDVVPVSGQWRHGSPFSGAIEGGWIYGRGTADMKGSIASLLMAVQALRATRVAPKMNLEISFTADEETDSVLGTGWLVQNTPIRPDFAIVMEGGEGRDVCCGHNGTLWLEVTVHGKPAHGSTPHKGVNALEKMAALVRAFDDYKRTLAARTWKSPEGRTHRPTVNLGGEFNCGQGAKINTVPAYASFTIDRRVLPLENHAAAERELRSFLAAAARKIPQCTISVKKISENYSCFSEPAHPFFAAMAGCVTRVRREKTRFNVSTGFNDMHFFSHHLKIPTLGYGPGGEDYHAVNERAKVKELLASAKIYAELLTTFGG
ncbi:MAG: ArgE/DapE family deacylase [Opitutus sp.]|nr:ArgE/DapE family deacylase [Opitutus sp.]